MWMPLGWVSASGGGTAASYELIATTVVASATPSVTFNLSAANQAAYKHLQIRATIQTATNGETVLMQFNGDTAANYRVHALRGDGTSATSADYGSRGSLVVNADSSLGGSIFGAAVIDILDFGSTTKNKTVRSLAGYGASTYQIKLYSGAWFSTSAVTSITLPASSGNIAVGSRFSLYGVRG